MRKGVIQKCFIKQSKMTSVPDGMWYGMLIISEVIVIPCRIGYDIVERTNKTYNKYKPGNRRSY
jgi:hypothetical protein